MTSTIEIPANTTSVGLLVARLIPGTLMAAHGSRKLFGWFGGHGLAGAAGFFEALGFRPGRLFAGTAAITEVASSVLIALGLGIAGGLANLARRRPAPAAAAH